MIFWDFRLERYHLLSNLEMPFCRYEITAVNVSILLKTSGLCKITDPVQLAENSRMLLNHRIARLMVEGVISLSELVVKASYPSFVSLSPLWIGSVPSFET